MLFLVAKIECLMVQFSKLARELSLKNLVEYQPNAMGKTQHSAVLNENCRQSLLFD